MDRRQFIQTSVAASIVAASPAVASPSKPAKRPNILYAFDDEHRFQSMPGEPFSDSINAPNLDAFRKANFPMDRCISNYPLCSPYRGILLPACGHIRMESRITGLSWAQTSSPSGTSSARRATAQRMWANGTFPVRDMIVHSSRRDRIGRAFWLRGRWERRWLCPQTSADCDRRRTSTQSRMMGGGCCSTM
jgi:hypothetical protein